MRPAAVNAHGHYSRADGWDEIRIIMPRRGTKQKIARSGVAWYKTANLKIKNYNYGSKMDESNKLAAGEEQPEVTGSNPYMIEEESLKEPENPLPRLSLEELPESLRAAVARAGWPSLMPVQSLALPYLLDKQDIMVQSRTGSGKTGAFLLPSLERLDPDKKECQALMLVPTRELALQVASEAEILFGNTGLKVAALYGGVSYGKQNDALHGGAQLVVGTPGRVLDHLIKRNFNLDALRMLVLDEADRMLSIGFYPDMKEVQRYLPKRSVPVHFFSATFPPQVLRVAKEFMPNPRLLSLSTDQVHHIDAMDHSYYVVKPMEKDRVLARILELESPSAAIIFCNTKSDVHYVTAVLKGFGYNADELSADLSQNMRERVLQNMRNGSVRFLVATDVAGRGIDIPELTHVILYAPPEDHESYIHRAGRTGRAGAGGTVISLVDIMQKMELARIVKHYKINMHERTLPTEEHLGRVVGERLTVLLEGELRRKTRLEEERMHRFMPLVKELAENEDSLKLLAMLLDEQYQRSLHAAPSQPAPEEHREPKRPASAGSDSQGASKNSSRKRRPRGRGNENRSK